MRRIVMPMAVAVVAVCATVALQVRAEPSDTDRATARALAREGYEASKREQFALAADRFQRADALVHAPTLLLGLARAQASMGKVVESQETYRRILREPLDPHAPDVFVKAVADARRESADVEPRIAWVTVTVQGPEKPKVQLDDAALGPTEVGVAVACDPGSHVLNVSADGYQPETRRFTAVEGSRQTLAVPLRALPEPPVAVARPELLEPAPPPPPPPRSSARPAAEIVAFTLGGAGLVAGGAAGVYTLVRHHDLEQECPGGHCLPGRSGDLSTYRTMANVSTVATIAGAAGVVAGLTLVLTAPRSSSVEAYAGPLGAGLAGRF